MIAHHGYLRTITIMYIILSWTHEHYKWVVGPVGVVKVTKKPCKNMPSSPGNSGSERKIHSPAAVTGGERRCLVALKFRVKSQKYSKTEFAISQMSIRCWYLLVQLLQQTRMKREWIIMGASILHHLVLTGGHVGVVRLPGPLGGCSPQRLHLLLFKAWLQPATCRCILENRVTGSAVERRSVWHVCWRYGGVYG